MNFLINKVISSIPDDIYQDLEPHITEVELRQGETIYQPGIECSHVCFPTTAIVSLQYLLETGDLTEFAMVGREGIVCLYLLLGSKYSTYHAVVQTSGLAALIPAKVLNDLMSNSGALRQIVFREAQLTIRHAVQGHVCRQHHSLEQQLSRLLLMILDRIDHNKVNKTHEEIGQLLGMRREAVSLTAFGLKRRGLIDYSRGSIEVIDRDALERIACECYRVLA